MNLMARGLVPLTAAAALLLAPAAGAQPAGRPGAAVDDATRAAARGIAEEALAHFDKGDFAGALNLFNKVDALVHAPTMGLMAARCLERLGRLVEASERYLAVAQAPLDANATNAQKNAQKSAETERNALLPKIPNLIIAVEGVTPDEAQVTIDGKSVPSALIGLKRPTDPGHHRVAVTRGPDAGERTVTLVPGETQTVTLRLLPGAAPPPGPATGTSGPTDDTTAAVGSGSPLRALGWAGVGVGGAGVLVGAIVGGLAVSAKSSLDAEGCVSGMCPSKDQGDVNHYNTLRLVSGGTLITGLALAAGGVTLVVLAPRGGAERPPAARVETWVGAASAGLRGSF